MKFTKVILTSIFLRKLWLITTWWRHLASYNLADIGPGNGLLPGGTNPLPDKMSTYHQRRFVAFVLGRCTTDVSANRLENHISISKFISQRVKWDTYTRLAMNFSYHFNEMHITGLMKWAKYLLGCRGGTRMYIATDGEIVMGCDVMCGDHLHCIN